MRSLKRIFICGPIGHKWGRTLDSIPRESVFFGMYCLRCGWAIDAVKARHIRDEYPELWAYIKGRMPQ